MKATPTPRPTKAGFTLIELLVVMAIIGVLIGLLLGAVGKIREVGQRTAITSDLNNLDMAATKFKTDFGFYPPDYIRLPGVVPDPTWATYGAGTPQQETYEGFQLLLKMFPRWQIPGVGAASSAPANTSTALAFLGTAVPAGGTPLQASQCLVFFLGGPTTQGFTPSGPYAPPATATSRKGPYFDFNTSRVNGTGAYLDAYGTPYAYFSSGGSTNYTSRGWTPPPVPQGTPAYVANYPTASPTVYALLPYKDASGKWVNAGRVQIISAGRNKRFGPGNNWKPGLGNYVTDGGPPAGDGGDDIANFNGAVLGVQGS